MIIAAKNDGGRPWELRRALTLDERRAVEGRKRVLDEWMKPGPPNLMKAAINEMFEGFGADPDRTEDDRDHRNENYAFACRERSAWGLIRACLKFRMGEVRAEDVGEKTLSLTWRPSSAQLNALAKRIEVGTATELEALTQILRGTTDLAASSRRDGEVKAAVGAVASYLTRRDADRHDEAVQRQLRAEAGADDDRKRAFAAADDTYRRAGLEPPIWAPGQIPVTLQMKLQNGWRIEDVEGRKVLVSPPRDTVGAER